MIASSGARNKTRPNMPDVIAGIDHIFHMPAQEAQAPIKQNRNVKEPKNDSRPTVPADHISGRPPNTNRYPNNDFENWASVSGSAGAAGSLASYFLPNIGANNASAAPQRAIYAPLVLAELSAAATGNTNNGKLAVINAKKGINGLCALKL